MSEAPKPSPSAVTEEMIKRMANRFLGWKLPHDFHPDAGISFEPEFNKEWNARHGKPPSRREPSGTNLFDATQATEMVRYMVEGLPALSQPSPAGADLASIVDNAYGVFVNSMEGQRDRKRAIADVVDLVIRSLPVAGPGYVPVSRDLLRQLAEDRRAYLNDEAGMEGGPLRIICELAAAPAQPAPSDDGKCAGGIVPSWDGPCPRCGVSDSEYCPFDEPAPINGDAS